MPTVSVVLASYNHGHFVRESIESALNQTSPPVELIIVDDGSTDESPDIIRSFGSEVTPIFTDRKGTYAALNTGIAMARGSWIAIHNSDDVWLPTKLERQLEVASRCPSTGIVHTSVQYIDA